MELKETIDLMLSDKVEDRLVAEYRQLDIRIEKLEKYLASGVYIVPPTKRLLKKQLKYMKKYKKVLEKRMGL